MNTVKNFKEFLLVTESQSFFKPFKDINLSNLDQDQTKKIQSISSEEGISMDEFLNKGATMEMIVESPGLKAGELFESMRSWLYKYYEDPKKAEGRWDKSINQGKIKGSFLVKNPYNYQQGQNGWKFMSAFSVGCDYDLDFYFKDDKFKVLYSNLKSIPPPPGVPQLTFNLSDPEHIRILKNYIKGEYEPDLTPKITPKEHSYETAFKSIYDAAYNNGAALLLSIKDQMKDVKPGQIGGSEFNF
jgi:hypothetical protein